MRELPVQGIFDQALDPLLHGDRLVPVRDEDGETVNVGEYRAQ
jgi:hypothetical protein